MRRAILALLAATTVGGCSMVWPNRLPARSISGLTATQRAVISEPWQPSKVTVQKTVFPGTASGSPARTVTTTTTEVGRTARICAEPSPDAMAATAKAITGGLNFPVGGATTVQASAGYAAGSSLAYIGMRTVMIQAVRDLGYRACEAYMNGAIGKQEYHDIVIGAPRIILGLDAIDALAGPAPVPPQILNPPSTSAENGANGAAAGAQPAAKVEPSNNKTGTSAADPRDATSWQVIAPAILRIACIAMVVPPPGVKENTEPERLLEDCLKATLPPPLPVTPLKKAST